MNKAKLVRRIITLKRRMKKEGSYTPEQVAAILNISPALVAKCVMVGEKLAPELLDAWEAQTDPVSLVDVLDIAYTSQESQFEEWWELTGDRIREEKAPKSDLAVADDRVLSLLVNGGWLIVGTDSEYYVTSRGVRDGLGPKKEG